ncbi:TylF/MycF/NovP-related O-methyltransferase [Microcoleus sp. FACHB-831]|uniref:class I SAM-dependent methyltransferase n=1 Tax=Microcoleus sp. FACHB-831 TaxID=2692827 RepID=UPI0018EFBEDD|nr:TylF/MycF/NovP-related O-methyltransferase [Microcoleus sp. FACHB-831]
MQSFIIITAADAKYFELVQGTILSIRQKPQGQNAIIGFFDLGCTPEQLQWLQGKVDSIKQADWDFNFPARNETPEYVKGLLVRPFLRQYFPNFDIYFWIDADAWVQNWTAVDLFIQGASHRGLAIVPEIDRGSLQQYGRLPQSWEWNYNVYKANFGEEIAEKVCNYPTLNAGVFALHKDAPHWQAWAQWLDRGLQAAGFVYTDQLALNLAVYCELFNKTEMLPAWCNWTCHYGLPAWNKKEGCLVEPYLPHTSIGILHLTVEKYDRVKLRSTDKDEVEVNVRYAEQSPASCVEMNDSISGSGKPQVGQIFTHEQAAYENTETSGGSFLPVGDYVSPGLAIIQPDRCFPNMIAGDRSSCAWPYLRGEIPHNWYVDKRYPLIGFANRDEVHILYNTALKFKGKRALEIGCWLGWSACHLALAGVELDVIVPLLEKPGFYASVRNSLEAAGVLSHVNLIPGYSPAKIEELAVHSQGKWALIFIDGNHDAPGPLNDAIAAEKFAEDDAIILFHDLASPDVAQGLDYLKGKGWQTMIYQTMQIMGVAWRGNIEPLSHEPDPNIKWHLPEHLQQHPISIGSKENTRIGKMDFILESIINIIEKINININDGYEGDGKKLVKLNERGKYLLIKGDLNGAFDEFQNAAILNSNSRVANKYLSWLYWHKGDIEKSIKHYVVAQGGNAILSSDSNDEFQQLLSAIRPYTLLSEARLFSLYSLAKQICLDDITGNFVECGTCRGGSAALLAFVIKRYSLRPRLLYAFDTFEGMPEPTDVDKHNGIPANDTGLGAGTLKAPILEGLDLVCRALDVRDIVVPVQGLFSHTLPQSKSEINNIALLHADGDWYELTMDIFNTLFEQVVDDGIIQVDDYGFLEGCRKALHEFERSHGLSFTLRIIDDTGVWFRKEDSTHAECEHWRTFWYLAQAAEKMGDVVLAQKTARAALKVIPGLAIAEEMLARLQHSLLKEELNLREINLIIFPDWEQPEELLLADLENALRAILTHPDRSHMTLLIETSKISKEEAELAISSVTMKIIYEANLDVAEQAEISLIDEFSKMKWKSLHNQIATRLLMSNENTTAIIEAGMEGVPSVDISKFSNQRIFQSEKGISLK